MNLELGIGLAMLIVAIWGLYMAHIARRTRLEEEEIRKARQNSIDGPCPNLRQYFIRHLGRERLVELERKHKS